MTRKHLIMAAVIAGVSTLGVVGLASAATSAKPGSLASELAKKFNLKESEVQGVIDNHKTEMQGYHESHYEDRLAKAVTDSKLTAAQKDLILAKHKELMSQAASLKESLKGKTPAERKAAMDKQRADIEAWEKTNNIPAGYLGGMGGRGFGHRFGNGGGPGRMHAED